MQKNISALEVIIKNMGIFFEWQLLTTTQLPQQQHHHHNNNTIAKTWWQPTTTWSFALCWRMIQGHQLLGTFFVNSLSGVCGGTAQFLFGFVYKVPARGVGAMGSLPLEDGLGSGLVWDSGVGLNGICGCIKGLLESRVKVPSLTGYYCFWWWWLSSILWKMLLRSMATQLSISLVA